MSLTGMALSLFLVAHVAGNLVVLWSPADYNLYSYKLTSNLALLYVAEAGLIGAVLIHIYLAIRVSQRNAAARPIAYVVKANTGRSRRWWGSSHMLVTGSVITAFIIFHLWHFKYGTHYPTLQDGVEMRDLARLVIEDFQKPLYTFLYVAFMVVIGMHLFHGFRSAFDTLGVNSLRRDRIIQRIGQTYVLIVFGGFILIPLWIFFFGGV